MATGSVVVRLPMVDVEEEFARTLGAEGSTRIERTGEGEYRAVSRAGVARVLQRFTLQEQGDDATLVEASVYVRPAVLGWLMRRLMGRRRLDDGVQTALERMARAATGEPEPEPEFGPEDFADEADDSGEHPPGDGGTGAPADRPQGGAFHQGTPGR